MKDTELYTDISSLPPDMKKEVQDFIQFLKSKNEEPSKKVKERRFGYAKDFFIMKPDFNDPIEDFKEYQ